MTADKALALLGLLATAGGWLASGLVARRPAPPPVEAMPAASESEVGAATARLTRGLQHLSSHRGAAYSAPSRNPFLFAADEPAGRVAAGAGRETASAAAGAPGDGALSGRPSMQLAGVAEDPGPAGPLRRAVITTAGELFVVGEGDLVLGRFRVSRIDAEAVELEDQAGGGSFVLVMR